MIGVLLLAFAFLLQTEQPYLATRADVLELNHVYDDCAKHQFSQLIAWNWKDDGATHVEWWCWASREETQFRLNGSRADLHVCNRWYRVQFGSYRETWTQHDREREDLASWPVELRSGLPEQIP